MKVIDPITLQEIQDAQKRITGLAMRTPLIRMNAEGMPGEIYLKLENMQPIGSFKIRGAASAMANIFRAA